MHLHIRVKKNIWKHKTVNKLLNFFFQPTEEKNNASVAASHTPNLAGVKTKQNETLT